MVGKARRGKEVCVPRRSLGCLRPEYRPDRARRQDVQLLGQIGVEVLLQPLQGANDREIGGRKRKPSVPSKVQAGHVFDASRLRAGLPLRSVQFHEGGKRAYAIDAPPRSRELCLRRTHGLVERRERSSYHGAAVDRTQWLTGFHPSQRVQGVRQRWRLAREYPAATNQGRREVASRYRNRDDQLAVIAAPTMPRGPSPQSHHWAEPTSSPTGLVGVL
ncbi:hypothetical protein SDC9_78422 [bioreactor metagenome]|uniref:Uncharacterized protein n=1 Tax=bioreactor metagenome TaxID=1076179 RepID=A0A644YTG3_9ZZZZ